MQIKNNPPSLAISLGAIVGAVFYLTFGGPYFQPAIIMAFLGASAFLIQAKTAFDAGGTEGEPTPRKFQSIAVLGISGLFTFLLLNIFIPELSFLSAAGAPASGQATLTTPFGVTAFAIGVAYSAAWMTNFIFNVFIVPPNEEQFFRVMIGNVFAKIAQRNAAFFIVIVPLVGAFPVVTMLAVGTIFAAFHLAVYGLNLYTLAILWGSGSFLYWFDLRAGDPLPSIFAHMANNALIFLYSGDILTIAFPSLQTYQGPTVTFLLPLLQVLPVLGMAMYVKFVKHRPLWGLTH